MALVRRLTVILVLLVLGACASGRVHSEYDPSVNISTYRTYDWKPGQPQMPRMEGVDRDLLDWRIRTAVDGQLIAKGFEKQSWGTPDFMVTYRITVREQTADTIQDYIWYKQAGGPGSPQEAYVLGYDQGTLVLEIFDQRTQRLAWRGSAETVVNPKGQEQTVRDAVSEMLQTFPPK